MHEQRMSVIRKTGLDLTAAGVVTIGTTENGTRRFYPVAVLLEIKSVTAFVTAATLSLGTNSATYNNLLAATALTGLSALNNMLTQTLMGLVIPSVAPNTDVKVNVTIGAVATGLTADVHVQGWYN